MGWPFNDSAYCSNDDDDSFFSLFLFKYNIFLANLHLCIICIFCHFKLWAYLKIIQKNYNEKINQIVLKYIL